MGAMMLVSNRLNHIRSQNSEHLRLSTWTIY